MPGGRQKVGGPLGVWFLVSRHRLLPGDEAKSTLPKWLGTSFSLLFREGSSAPGRMRKPGTERNADY